MQRGALAEPLLGIFRTELSQHIVAWDEALLALDAEPQREQIERLFRAAHSLKGAALTMAFGPLARYCAGLEDRLVSAQKAGFIETTLREDLVAASDVWRRAARCLEQGERPDDCIHADRSGVRPSNDDHERTIASSSIEVLAVEDSPTQARELALRLTTSGLRVRVVGTLDQAFAALEERPSDAVLLDLELPDATGLEGLARLHARYGAIPVVVLTSRKGEESALAALQCGAEDYIHKDALDGALLSRSLRYAIERNRARLALGALAEELRANNAELSRLNAQKDAILGVVAHDLRNPLGVVRGYADFLRGGFSGELTSEQHEILTLVRRTTDYMLTLVEDLVDFSLIQTGRLELERTRTNFAELVREAVRVQNMVAQEKRIRIEIERLDDPAVVDVDHHKMRQVIDNLLSNAVKFSYPDTHVSVTLRCDEERMVLAVEDRGAGIESSEVGRIFVPFEKIRTRPTAGERSTRLGLAIVRNIVEAHGGHIYVSSTEGVGSIFRVELARTGTSKNRA